MTPDVADDLLGIVWERLADLAKRVSQPGGDRG